jgi:hypothetical protein
VTEAVVPEGISRVAVRLSMMELPEMRASTESCFSLRLSAFVELTS